MAGIQVRQKIISRCTVWRPLCITFIMICVSIWWISLNQVYPSLVFNHSLYTLTYLLICFSSVRKCRKLIPYPKIDPLAYIRPTPKSVTHMHKLGLYDNKNNYETMYDLHANIYYAMCCKTTKHYYNINNNDNISIFNMHRFIMKNDINDG